MCLKSAFVGARRTHALNRVSLVLKKKVYIRPQGNWKYRSYLTVLFHCECSVLTGMHVSFGVLKLLLLCLYASPWWLYTPSRAPISLGPYRQLESKMNHEALPLINHRPCTKLGNSC